MEIRFNPEGVCPIEMRVEIDDKNRTLQGARFIGGCMGNAVGLCRVIEGVPLEEVIEKLEGIDCGGRGTSCPDQLAKALKAWLAENDPLKALHNPE